MQLLEQQKKRILEQDKIIQHLVSRLSSTSPPNTLEEVEGLALARLPKVQGINQESGASSQEVKESVAPVLTVIEECGDSDSAIQLDCSYDSQCLASRPLARSVSDVVVRPHHFPTTLYRGFLLRHQRRQKDYSPDLGSQEARGARDTVCVTIRQSASQRSLQTPRMVKNRCRRQKTTIIINPREG